MRLSPEQLLEQASHAKPTPSDRPKPVSYRDVWPAYQRLRKNGLRPMEAIDWLIENEALTAQRRINCYHAMINRERRAAGIR